MRKVMKFFSSMLVLVLLGFLGASLPRNGGAAPAKTEIVVDVSRPVGPVNPMVLGNNVQWVDKADELWDSDARTFDASRLDKLKLLKIKTLRFPGGSQADVYHWKDGVGAVELRKPGTHIFLDTQEPSYFGTDEFLDLAAIFDAEPMITVNVVTGTPQEAADWVAYCRQKRAVTYWEIGNEPYLKPAEAPDFDPNYPEIFARRFVEFAQAMKAVDPAIRVGLPLRSNQMGRYPGTPYSDWNARVLAIAGGAADFVCLHNAYFNAIFEAADYKYPDTFAALMAAPAEVAKDIESVKAEVSQALAGKSLPIAVTEYSAFVALPEIPGSESTGSLGGALYAGALLMDFFNNPSITMAHFWSLTGNWVFGTISQMDIRRPQYHMLKVFSDFVGDRILHSEIRNNPKFDAPESGFLPAKSGVESLQVLATLSDIPVLSTNANKRLYVVILNKSLTRDISVQLTLRGFSSSRRPVCYQLTGPDIRSNNESAETVSLKPMPLAKVTSFTVLRHSLTAIHLDGNV